MAIMNKILRIFIVFLLVFGVPGQALALPQGENVVHGGASFVTSGNNMVVNQTTDRAIIEYNSFSIGALETVRFQQPNSSSVALNRVIGVDPSSILGSLNANGRIFLVNPNGIIFGPDSRIDTAGLVASTLDISNTDFLNGDLIFSGTGGSVINYGKININKPGGYAVLLGAYVKNEGQIVANLASIALASGELVTLSLDSEGLIQVAIDQETSVNPEDSQAAVENTGTLEAGGGRTVGSRIVLTAEIVDGVFDQAINTSGIIEAKTLRTMDGQIALLANKDISVGGQVNGGRVEVQSDEGYVTHEEGSSVNTGNNTFRGYAAEDYVIANDAVIQAGGDVDIFAGQNIFLGTEESEGSEGPGSMIKGRNVFLTADQGVIEQLADLYAVEAQNLIASASQGIYGTGSNEGLQVLVNSFAAENRDSGDLKIFVDQDVSTSDLSSLSGLNAGVAGLEGIVNEAEEGEVDIFVNGDFDIYANVVSDQGNITIETDGDLLQHAGGDILVMAAEETSDLPQPVNLDSPSHQINVASEDNTIDMTWQVGDAEGRENGHVQLISGGRYAMESGTKVETNGGDVDMNAVGDIELALVDAGTGSVNVLSQEGSVLDGDLGVAPGDYDIIAHRILMSAPNGTIGGAGTGEEIDVGSPYSFSYLWIDDASASADTAVDSYSQFLNELGEWVFATTSPALAEGNNWWFHVKTVDELASAESDQSSLGPFVIAGPGPGPGPAGELYPDSLIDDFRVYYEVLSPSQFLSFDPATTIGLYAYHPLTPIDQAAFDDIRLDVDAYEFIDNNIGNKKTISPYYITQ